LPSQELYILRLSLRLSLSHDTCPCPSPCPLYHDFKVGARLRRVRSKGKVWRAGQVTQVPDIGPPTDATQWRPYPHPKRLPSQSTGLRFPFEFCLEVGLTTHGQPFLG